MVIIFLLSGILSAIAVSFAERHMLSVTRYGMKSKKIKNAPDKPIAVISDLHCVSFGRGNKKLIKKILSLDPCALVIAGDLITGTVTKNMHVAKEFLEEISKHLPVYYGFGNHERRAEECRGEAFYTSDAEAVEGVTLLKNKCADLPFENIRIYGFDQPAKSYKRKAKLGARKLETALGKADRRHFNILIAHDPEHFRAYARWGADLVLSGHNHGGIVRLPFLGGVISPRRELFPKYDSGCFRKGRHVMLVSRGLGSHTIPLRVFNRPEIMLVFLGEKD